MHINFRLGHCSLLASNLERREHKSTWLLFPKFTHMAFFASLFATKRIVPLNFLIVAVNFDWRALTRGEAGPWVICGALRNLRSVRMWADRLWSARSYFELFLMLWIFIQFASYVQFNNIKLKLKTSHSTESAGKHSA